VESESVKEEVRAGKASVRTDIFSAQGENCCGETARKKAAEDGCGVTVRRGNEER